MKAKTKNILFWIGIVFIVFIIVLLSNIPHELSHYQDFHHIAFNESMDYFIMPKLTSNLLDQGIAHYKFSIYEKDMNEYNRISGYTELKALAFEIIFIALFMLIPIALIYHKYKKRRS